MDYRIILLHVYTCTPLGTTGSESAQQVCVCGGGGGGGDSHNFCIVILMGFEPWVFRSWVWLSCSWSTLSSRASWGSVVPCVGIEQWLFFIVILMGFEPWVFGSWVWLSCSWTSLSSRASWGSGCVVPCVGIEQWLVALSYQNHTVFIENCRTHNPLILWTVHLYLYMWQCTWVHIPGDPQSVELRNATTTTLCWLVITATANMIKNQLLVSCILFLFFFFFFFYTVCLALCLSLGCSRTCMHDITSNLEDLRALRL